MADNKGVAVDGAGDAGGGDPFGGAVLPGNEGLDGGVDGAAPEEKAKPEEGDQGGEAEGAEAKAEGEEKPEGEAEGKAEGDEPKAEPEAAKPEKLYAGKYKTPEDLEVAYQHSSAEGKRLYSKVKEMESGFAKRESELLDKISELEIRAEVGPEPKDLTEEDLEKMGPAKAALALQKQTERKAALRELKAKAEARAKAQKDEEAKVKAAIDEQLDAMESDDKSYPDFGTLKPRIGRLMEANPHMTGHPNAPLNFYLMAYGLQALALRGKAAKQSAESEAKAKAKAKAAAVGAGAAGAGGTATPPVKAVQKGSEDDGDAAMDAAFKRRSFSF